MAERYNGEIINGDALQMYEGLPITTNKISPEEKKGIPHHLLGCVKLGEEPWTVKKFHDKARDICQDIRSRGRLPILVGGTHYYMQAMLFENSLVDHEPVEPEPLEGPKWPVLEGSTEDMYAELQRIDPVMAMRWHPKDRRKIRRSLEIWLQSGTRASDIYEEQRQSRSCSETVNEGANGQGSFTSNDLLVFWTYASSEALNTRLDKRVNKMIEDGLYQEVKELDNFVSSESQAGHQIDQSSGIWIAIGYKECLPYVLNKDASSALETEAIDRTKISTRQYAKRQVRWIRLKLLPAVQSAGLEQNLFLLDSTNLSKWPSEVEAGALKIVGSFLKGEDMPQPAALSSVAQEMLVAKIKQGRAAKHCEACGKTLMSEEEWRLHLKSKGHRSATRPRPAAWRTKAPIETVKDVP